VPSLRYGSSLHLSLIPHRDRLRGRVGCVEHAGEYPHGVRLEQIAEIEHFWQEPTGELHPFPLDGLDVVGKAADALSSNASAGIGWACRHGRIDRIILGEPDGFALRFQA